MTRSTDNQGAPRGGPVGASTPARAVAVALIALTVLGLLYLRFAGGSDQASVPKGAQAGDLLLESCTYDTEDGAYAADCGTLVVPENRADAGSRLIALPVTRIRARSDDPAEPIFRLEGGPGLTNMEFRNAGRFADRHDVVLVGYRGVDGSVRLDCPEVESALAHSGDLLAERSQRRYADAFRACADRLREEGVDLAGYGLPQQVEDLEAARRALGYDRVDLLSESAGTRTALIYAWRHPGSIHRSVMIGANPPGHFVWDAEAGDEQLERYAALCAKDPECDERTDDLAASVRQANRDVPDRWWFLPIEAGNARVASFLGLMESTDEAPVNGPAILDAWLSGGDGDASGQWFQSLAADLLLPKLFVWGQWAAAGIIDAEAARAYFASGDGDPASFARAATSFVWGGGRLADAWPADPEADEYARMRRSEVETLLIGGELDGTTPPQVATREVLPHLPNGRQVVLSGLGHTVDFWTQQPEASTRLIGTYLETGRVDESLYEPQRVDFTPTVGQGAIAKIVLGSMLGLAALTAVSLGLMARRVRRRGGFGRAGGAVLRSVGSLVLGVGGWLLGALVVLTTVPTVPLDDELLAVLSIGVPVGLGVYLAWVQRAWPAQLRLAGLAATSAGALAGGWLGFSAGTDLVALLTTVVGAVAGANLALLVLDSARGQWAGARVAARPAVAGEPTRGPSPA